jgi:3-carboxy-cis,cis-muconate cycloisomerase
MMLAAAKIVREQHSVMLDAMVQDHERATGQWHVEWQAIPTAFIVASAGLRAAREALEGLEIRPETMRRVLGMSGGLIVAEAVMMGLAPVLGRQIAHDVVYECCRAALTRGTDLLEALEVDPRVSGNLDPATLKALVDPANYLGAAPEMTRRLLQKREAAVLGAAAGGSASGAEREQT